MTPTIEQLDQLLQIASESHLKWGEVIDEKIKALEGWNDFKRNFTPTPTEWEAINNTLIQLEEKGRPFREACRAAIEELEAMLGLQ